jgi:hypothetical protein
VLTATLAEIQNKLGTPVASYGPRKRRWREAWIWPLPGFILSGLLVITGLDWYYYGYTQYGPIAAQSWSQDWLFWGILAGVITLFITIWQVIRSRVRVHLYRYGIVVYLPLQGSRSLRWEDITGISSVTIQDSVFGHIFHTRHQVFIYTTQWKPFTLDDRVGNLLELITRLKANLYPRLLPGLRARFQQGQQITFGPLSIQANSLYIRGKQIPWENVSYITVNTGHLLVETIDQGSERCKKLRISVHQIPNLELVLQVLQRGLSQPS